jgi:hypothetical protein
MRLLAGPAGPQPEGLRFGCVQIADRKIQMHLFWDRAARPGRRLVTGYPQCRNRGAFISHHDDIVAYRCHFATEERRPERCETSRVLTIEADQSQASQCHRLMLAPTPQRQQFRRLGDHAHQSDSAINDIQLTRNLRASRGHERQTCRGRGHAGTAEMIAVGFVVKAGVLLARGRVWP